MRRAVFILVLLVLSCAFLLGIDKTVAQGGEIEGTVYVKNHMGDLNQVGWANITAKGGSVTITPSVVFNAGGGYYFFLPSGSYMVTCSVPGCKSQSVPVSVTDGSTTPLNFYLTESGVPIPEFPQYAAPLVTALSLLLVIALTRKRVSLQKGLN